MNKAEMEELKDAFFWSNDVDEEILGDIDAPWKIPDEVIYEHFDDISFVDEDFFCNINDGNFEGCGAVYM